MQKRLGIVDVQQAKQRLEGYDSKQIEFNDHPPNYHIRLICKRRGITKKFIKNLLEDPRTLFFVGKQEAKNPNYDYVYDLWYKTKGKYLQKVVVTLNPKSLYVVTALPKVSPQRFERERAQYER